jgi:hypothetical protein
MTRTTTKKAPLRKANVLRTANVLHNKGLLPTEVVAQALGICLRHAYRVMAGQYVTKERVQLLNELNKSVKVTMTREGMSWEVDGMSVVIFDKGVEVMRIFAGEVMESIGRAPIEEHIRAIEATPWISTWHPQPKV